MSRIISRRTFMRGLAFATAGAIVLPPARKIFLPADTPIGGHIVIDAPPEGAYLFRAFDWEEFASKPGDVVWLEPPPNPAYSEIIGRVVRDMKEAGVTMIWEREWR